MRGAHKRRVRAFNDQMTAAYYAALAPHQKKPPPLKDFLIREDPRPRRAQAWQEIKASLMLAIGPGGQTQRNN